MRLFFAFDDPYSAIALAGLAETVKDRRVRLLLEPVVERGIPDDPAREAKRRYAIADSRRLARDLGLELARSDPVAPESVASIAAGAAAIPQGAARAEFCLAAMDHLWFEANEEPDPAACLRVPTEADPSGPSADAPAPPL